MPEKRTVKAAREKKRQGKAPTTQAGEFVREEMEHAQRGKHRVKSRKQAIAIGLSKARRSGVDLPAPKKGKTSKSTRSKAERDYRKGQGKSRTRTVRRRTAKSKSSSSKSSGPAKRKSGARSRKK